MKLPRLRTFLGRLERHGKIIVVLLVIALLPLLIFTIFEFSRINQQEALLQEIYDTQLDAILFSINQYCWDVVGGWGHHLRSEMNQRLAGATDAGAQSAALRALVIRYSTLAGAFSQIADQLVIETTAEVAPAHARLRELLWSNLRAAEEPLARIRNQSAKGYFRPLGLQLDCGSDCPVDMALVYAFDESSHAGAAITGGVLLSSRTFVDQIIQPYVARFAESGVLVVIKDKSKQKVLIGEKAGASQLREEELWILPNLSLGLQTTGSRRATLAAEQTRRTVLLVVMLDAVIAIALFVLVRLLLRESRFAQLKADFVAHVSHDLRTPLGLIRMYAETLEMQRVTSESKQREYHTTIAREAERLSRMVNNVLDFSRIEAGRKKYELRPVNLAGVVEEVLGSYRFYLEQRGFEVRQQIAADTPAVRADAEAVAQALMNLIDNAVKYSDQQKQLTVRLASADEVAVLSVSDCGIGIAPKHQSRIFEKFYRIETAGGETRGAGIGLALVQHIMAAHGGTVEVVSSPGRGSTFSLRFPLANADHRY